MKKVKVEVIGTEPACKRCKAASDAVKRAAERLKNLGIELQIEKANVMSKEIIQKYGVILTPAIAINDTLRIVGRIPTVDEVEKLIIEDAKKIIENERKS